MAIKRPSSIRGEQTNTLIASGKIGLSTEELVAQMKAEGKDVKVTVLPAGKRSTGTAKSPTSVKKSVPQRDAAMESVAEMLRKQGFTVKIGPKGISYLNGTQWLTIAITANRSQPDELSNYEFQK